MNGKYKFKYTSEGYAEAVKFLKSIGKYDSLNTGFSTDGWSIIQLANSLYKTKQTEELINNMYKRNS